MLQTPVAFFIFKRPDLTARVFAAIAAQKPARLLVVADGPHNEAERALCEQTRALIKVDWPCAVETNYSDENRGCKMRVSSGLDWVFERVEEAIILEDDCLPHPDFFGFCEAMLARYRDDERVMHISGDCFVPLSDASVDYGFSRYVHGWGWASWRRAWRHYDVTAARWPLEREDILAACLDKKEARYWNTAFESVFRGRLDTWDYQWALACWLNQGLAIVPRVNLISNIGFRGDGTHTKDGSGSANLPTGELSVENHPSVVRRDELADARVRALLIHNPPMLRMLWARAIGRARRMAEVGSKNR